MAGYIRTDCSYTWSNNCFYLIPTIEISTFSKGFEISFYFLGLCIYAVISYISEEKYEP